MLRHRCLTNCVERDSILANEKRRLGSVIHFILSFLQVDTTKAQMNGLPTRPFHARTQSFLISFGFASAVTVTST
jgi:hypothetical protein